MSNEKSTYYKDALGFLIDTTAENMTVKKILIERGIVSEEEFNKIYSEILGLANAEVARFDYNVEQRAVTLPDMELWIHSEAQVTAIMEALIDNNLVQRQSLNALIQKHEENLKTAWAKIKGDKEDES